LGIAALENKIVQQAVVTILNRFYEVDFKGFSYGFRPARSPHQALDALVTGLERKKVNWVARCGHPWLLRQHEPRVDAQVHRAQGG
jgi:retron-type reverse transcriptase